MILRDLKSADKNFQDQFTKTQKTIERAHRWAPVIMVVAVLAGFTFLGFVCWAIYRLVTHFT